MYGIAAHSQQYIADEENTQKMLFYLVEHVLFMTNGLENVVSVVKCWLLATLVLSGIVPRVQSFCQFL